MTTTTLGAPKALATLLDEAAIRDVIYTYCRAIDRCDKQLLLECYWPDAVDAHGFFSGTAAEFADWVMPGLASMNHTSHNITNVLVSTRDDTATSEAYFMAYHSVPGESRDVDWIAAGRYLDRFERREGLWKIAGRRVVYDWMQRAPSRSDWEESPLKDMLIRGRRGFDDPVYHV